MQLSVKSLSLGLFGLLAVCGVGLCLALVLVGPDDLFLTALMDDGFYFLTLARNIAAGDGATFDGLGSTNGFHPLWAIVLTPIFWLKYSSLYIPVRLAILLTTLLHLGAAAAVYRAVRLLTDRYAATLTALCYVGNPLALYLVVSGMESALVALLVALLAGESIRIRQGIAPLEGVGRILGVGLLCGLCMLARTDTILLVGLVLAGALVAPRRKAEADADSGVQSTFGTRLRGSFLTGMVAVATVSPWLIWNLVRFGTVVQVSAQAHHLHSIHLHTEETAAGVGRFLEMAGGVVRQVFNSISSRTGVPASVIILLLVAAVGVLFWWLVSRLASRDQRRDSLWRLWWLDAPVLYGAGFLAATFLILGHIRSWYLAGPLVAGALLLSIPVHDASRRTSLPGRGRIAAVLLVLCLTLGLQPLEVVFTHEMITNAQQIPCWREASEWVGAHTTPGTRVSSFNSGTFGYLSPRTVVNLDCVINNRALPYLEERRLLEFLHGNQIRYIIDGPYYLNRYLPSYAEPGWQQALVPVDTLSSGLVVLEVRD